MLNWIVWNRTICIKMHLALNNLQRLICHKNQTANQPNFPRCCGEAKSQWSANRSTINVCTMGSLGCSIWRPIVLQKKWVSWSLTEDAVWVVKLFFPAWNPKPKAIVDQVVKHCILSSAVSPPPASFISQVTFHSLERAIFEVCEGICFRSAQRATNRGRRFTPSRIGH